MKARRSQPSWAAWIEITKGTAKQIIDVCRSPLGLRGLKYHQRKSLEHKSLSQPTRAAWIEIYHSLEVVNKTRVAAHSGCVD